jgi:hypothetical protein
MSDQPLAAQAAAGLVAIAHVNDASDATIAAIGAGDLAAAAAGATRAQAPQPARASRANKRSTLSRMCKECGTTDTPSWRRGADGARTLCNACGLKFLRDFRKGARLSGEAEPAHLLVRPLAHPIPPKKRPSLSHPPVTPAASAIAAAPPPVSESAIPHADCALHPRSSSPHSDCDAIFRSLSGAAAVSSTAKSDVKKTKPSVDFEFILNDAATDQQ